MSMHMDDHAVKLLVARHREDNEARPDAYYCTKAPLGCGHYVRMDNPMNTGRCENCRRFVCHLDRGWRTCSIAEAARWGVLGRRSG